MNTSPGKFFSEQAMKIINSCYGFAVKPDYEIAFKHASLSRGTVWLERDNKYGAINRKIEEANNSPLKRYILAGHTNEASTYSAIANQPSGDKLRGVYRNRKAYSLSSLNDRCVHSDNLGAGIYQWTA